MTNQSSTSRNVLIAVAAELMVLCFGSTSVVAQYCTLQDLGALSTTFQQSSASGINSRGQVVGTTSVEGRPSHAFLFEDGVMKDLGTLSAAGSSTATAINNRGQIVGSSAIVPGYRSHAFLYEDGQMTDLGTLSSDPANHNSEALAINDRGQIVGVSETDGPFPHAFLYEDGKMIDLGTLPGEISSGARGINNRGQIVGYSRDTGWREHAFLYDDGAMVDLGKLPGDTSSMATGINERGQVVGASYNIDGGPFTWHPVLFEKGRVINLAPGSGFGSVASAIDNRGDVIGFTILPPQSSILFDKSQVIPLTDATGTLFRYASGVNDRGQIVGTVLLPNSMGWHAAICTPTH